MGDAFSVLFILSCLGVMLLLPGRDASPSQGYPPAVCRRYPFIHLREERQSGVLKGPHQAPAVLGDNG